MKEMEKRESKLVSGGARGAAKETYKFHCKKCGYSWEERTANPGDHHGCPNCGWWFMKVGGNSDANGNIKFDNECLEYSLASPKTGEPQVIRGAKSITIQF